MARKMTQLVLGYTGKAFDDAIAQNSLSQRDGQLCPPTALRDLPDAMASRCTTRLMDRITVEPSELFTFNQIVL